MRKKRSIILGVLILGLILIISIVFINRFQKQTSEESPTETANDIFQSEEQSDTEVEFSDTEPNNQQNKEDTKFSEDIPDSSDANKNPTSNKQEGSKNSEEVTKTDATKDSEQEKDPNETKDPEEEKNPEQEKDPEQGDNSENSSKDGLWTGFY